MIGQTWASAEILIAEAISLDYVLKILGKREVGPIFLFQTIVFPVSGQT